MMDAAALTPDEAKARIQFAYATGKPAEARRFSPLQQLIDREPKLYGHDAGVDFVDTHFSRFFSDACTAAAKKKTVLNLTFAGWGRNALTGAAERLRALIGLDVWTDGPKVEIVLARDAPLLLTHQ